MGNQATLQKVRKSFTQVRPEQNAKDEEQITRKDQADRETIRGILSRGDIYKGLEVSIWEVCNKQNQDMSLKRKKGTRA